MRDTFALAQHLGYLIVLSADCPESPKNSTVSRNQVVCGILSRVFVFISCDLLKILLGVSLSRVCSRSTCCKVFECKYLGKTGGNKAINSGNLSDLLVEV